MKETSNRNRPADQSAAQADAGNRDAKGDVMRPEQFAESTKLEKAIRSNLRESGYG